MGLARKSTAYDMTFSYGIWLVQLGLVTDFTGIAKPMQTDPFNCV